MKAKKLILIFLLLGVSYYFYREFKKNSFPGLELASYEGSISGFQKNLDQKSSIYIERIKGAAVLLVYLFIEGSEPKLINYTKNADGSYKKLKLRHDGESYFLVGGSGGLRGEVYKNKTKVGEWELRKRTNSIFKELEKEGGDLSRLVLNKARHQSLKEEFDRVSKEYKERSKEFVKLKSLISDRKALAVYAKEKREELDEELKQALGDQEELDNEVEEEYQKLLYKRRISKTGRAIETARKIQKREEAEFLASIPAEKRIDLLAVGPKELEKKEDKLSIEEQKLLSEYQYLEEAIIKEKKSIGQLERRLLERRAGKRQTKGKIRKKKWWKLWD